MPKDTIAPGRVLAGRYRLVEILGEGGFGTVWVGHHLVLDAPVAVKLINADIAEDEVAVERFLREAKAAASLRSPHVVQILDYGVDDGQPFIAMELLEGETLSQRIKRAGRLGAGEAVRILGQVARAIGRAHEAGVVHRDLKPENVFLVRNDDEEVAKVLDFGVAKVDAIRLGVKSTATRTGSLLGTPFYMSPEQVLGNKEVDHRSDLWSMGVIAFEMITGKRPFVSDGLGDLVLQITVRPLPVPSQIAPVAAGFDVWFAHAMAREPAARFNSARELVESLREALDLGAESADAVVTVPEPGEEPPAALRPARPERSRAETTPDRRRVTSDAPTVLADSDGPPAYRGAVGEGADPAASGQAARSGRARVEGNTVSQFTTPAEPPRRRRGPALAIGIAFGALAIGLVGGVAVLGLTPPSDRPLPAVGAPGVRAVDPPNHRVAPEDDAVPPPAPGTADSPGDPAVANPSASGVAAGLPSSNASGAPGAAASSDAGPPPEWLPQEVDGGIVKPDWARPEPEPPPPPPPEEGTPTPYD